MNILVLTPDIPASSSMPGSPRAYEFCKQLAREHSLFLCCFSSGPEREQLLCEHKDSYNIFREIKLLPSEPAPTRLGKFSHRIRLASHLSSRFRNREYFHKIVHEIQLFADLNAIDAVYIEGLRMTQFVPRTLASNCVVDLVDCLTILYLQILQNTKTLIGKLKVATEVWSLGMWERGISRRFPKVVLVAERDENLLRKLARTDSQNFYSIPNGIDTDYFSPQETSRSDNKLVFTGVMTYGPNADAVMYFAKEILPLIRETHPQIQFQAVGAGPSAELLSLNAEPGVHVTGYVSDIRPYLAEAAVFVCPIRYGTGMKNKLLSAFSMNSPVVATSASTLGLAVLPDEHLLVADEPASFAKAIDRLLRNPQERAELALSARELATSQYSWAESTKRLENLLREVREL